MNRPQIIVVTPIKNEDWILDRFLSTTSLWADNIIIADQCSTDFNFQLASCLPGIKQYWLGHPLPYGYYDDGIEHTNTIHKSIEAGIKSPSSN